MLWSRSRNMVPRLRSGSTASARSLLTIKRDDQPLFDLELTRAKIDVPAVTLKMLDGNIAHIEVNIFGDKTTAEFNQALKDAQDQKATGPPSGCLVRTLGILPLKSAKPVLGRHQSGVLLLFTPAGKL